MYVSLPNFEISDFTLITNLATVGVIYAIEHSNATNRGKFFCTLVV